MKILVLGGTIFVGRHIVEAALDAGHEVTLFNRGQTNTDLFPHVEKLRGNRHGELDALKNRTWDVAIDVNGYVPRDVWDSASLLSGHIGHYIYVSSGAVYQTPFPPNGDESSPIRLIDGDPLAFTLDHARSHYGEMKYLCEVMAEKAMPGRALVCRLGLVAGRCDDTDRATYWVVRASRGGSMVVPGRPDAAFQVVHGRDFGDFVIHAAETTLTGLMNTTGQIISWGQWLDSARRITGSDVEYVWIDDDDFLKQTVGTDWDQFPLYITDWGEWWMNNSDLAQAHGLRYRPTDEIVRDILDYHATRPADYEMKMGLSAEEEAAVLSAWSARQQRS